MEERSFQKNSITKRWVTNTFGVILCMMMLVAVIACAALRSYYYGVVQMNLEHITSESVASYFSVYIGADEERFESGARSYVESFADKNAMEVWVVDNDGRVIVSSSGFAVTDNYAMPQYYNEAAKETHTTAMFTGRLPSGEKVMAYTVFLPVNDGKPAGAVRYITSLEAVDRQLLFLSALVACACLFAVFLVGLSGTFFIQSIVNPVRKINSTAQKIADGDFNARIDSHRYNDEIGELCETINYMAGEIGDGDRMKNEFISTISHELRTPLTAIKGWGETLEQVGSADPTLFKKGLDVIISESERLSGLVEDLLDFSRIQSGRMSMRKEKLDVLAELDDAVFVFKERAIREGIELIYNAPTLPAPMEGDGDRIKQVFVNILDNAIKYTGQGGTVLTTAQIDSEKIEITVADTGCGIPQADLPRVKEKFYKANTSVRGSGIGLAVTDEIVRLHNGTLQIDSREGEGTTVTITFPIDPVELPQEIVAPADQAQREELAQIVKEQQQADVQEKGSQPDEA